MRKSMAFIMNRLQAERQKQFGMSLIELGLVMVIVSVALVPVIQTMSGPNSNTGNGNVVQVIGQKSKEIILANTIIGRALSTDYAAFNCGIAGFNPKTGFPVPGQSKNFPTSSRCVDSSYNQTLYYQWSVRNLDPTGAEIPVGNHYYAAVLNVWNTPTGGTPLITMPTAFYWNESAGTTTQKKTGVLVLLDQSNSMAYGSEYPMSPSSPPPPLKSRPMCLNGEYPGSPYLKYRHTDPNAYWGSYTNSGASLGDINDNNNLDIVSLWGANDGATPYNDLYMKKGILGMPSNCSTITTAGSAIFDFGGSTSPIGKYWRQDPRPNGPDDDTPDQAVGHMRNLCNIDAYGTQGSAGWNTILNENLSRMEIARSSMLSFLLGIEANSDLYQNTKLAFTTYSSVVNRRVLFEDANSQGRFPNMRRKFSWVNRSAPGHGSANGTDNGPILPIAYTNLYVGVQESANQLFADTSLNSRILFIVGDGIPECGIIANCPNTSVICEDDHNEFKSMAQSMGNGTYPGANGNKITILALGLMDSKAPAYLRDDLAVNTPGGQYFHANSIYEVKTLFEQIQYQIQRIILLDKANRFNVKFS